MQKPSKPKVLIVDDMASNISLLTNLLKKEYEIFFAKNGEKALEIATKKRPDLILLDIVMPGISGYDVCRKLKGNADTRAIPVIFVSAMGEEYEETTGIEIGAADYIIKPFQPLVLRTRVDTHVKLKKALDELHRFYSMPPDVNSKTGLAGLNGIALTIEKAMRDGDQDCVIYTDLDNLKAFNSKYGFARGDEVILFTARVLTRSLADAGCAAAFAGHIGGDDFVFMAPSEKREEIVRRIMDRFDDGITEFYTGEDVAAGCISIHNRRGDPQTFPIMSIRMAGVDLSLGAYRTYMEVNDAGAELIKKAKADPGSCFHLDQRGKSK